jgi:hypothetical protein
MVGNNTPRQFANRSSQTLTSPISQSIQDFHTTKGLAIQHFSQKRSPNITAEATLKENMISTLNTMMKKTQLLSPI